MSVNHNSKDINLLMVSWICHLIDMINFLSHIYPKSELLLNYIILILCFLVALHLEWWRLDNSTGNHGMPLLTLSVFVNATAGLGSYEK